LKSLQDEKAKLVGAYDGAIQDCIYWISQLDKPTEEVAPTEAT
jgi:hypothetical protein